MKRQNNTEKLLSPNLGAGLHVAVLDRAVAIIGPERARTLQVYLSRESTGNYCSFFCNITVH